MSNIQRVVLFCVLISLGVPSTAMSAGWNGMNRRFYRYHTMTNLRAERHQMQTLYPSPFVTWVGGRVDQSLEPGGILDLYLRGLLKNANDTKTLSTPSGAMRATEAPSVDQDLLNNRELIRRMLEVRGLPETVELIKESRTGTDGSGTTPPKRAPEDKDEFERLNPSKAPDPV